MRISQAQIDVGALQASWLAFDSLAHLRPIHSEAEYDRMVALMQPLLDVAGDDEDHPLSSLLELAGDLVSRYEREHHAAIEPASLREALRFLMESRGLMQENLSAIVAQSNLSAILAGKRKISATMAGNLGKFSASVRLYLFRCSGK